MSDEDKKREIKAVLFDLDGVIIDSFDSWYEAFCDTLDRFQMERISREKFRREYWGPDLRENLKKIRIDEPEKAANYCLERQIKNVSRITLFPKVKHVLKYIKKRYKTGLVTNTPKKNALSILDYFGLRNYFDVVVTSNDVVRGKPNPEIIIKACRSIDVDPRETALIGDTWSDISAGKKAGCFVIRVRQDEGEHEDNEVLEVDDIDDIRHFL